VITNHSAPSKQTTAPLSRCGSGLSGKNCSASTIIGFFRNFISFPLQSDWWMGWIDPKWIQGLFRISRHQPCLHDPCCSMACHSDPDTGNPERQCSRRSSHSTSLRSYIRSHRGTDRGSQGPSCRVQRCPFRSVVVIPPCYPVLVEVTGMP